MIVPDAPVSREQLNRDIEDKVGAVIALLLRKKSIADRLEFWWFTVSHFATNDRDQRPLQRVRSIDSFK
jgi:hypothetical protein